MFRLRRGGVGGVHIASFRSLRGVAHSSGNWVKLPRNVSPVLQPSLCPPLLLLLSSPHPTPLFVPFYFHEREFTNHPTEAVAQSSHTTSAC